MARSARKGHRVIVDVHASEGRPDWLPVEDMRFLFLHAVNTLEPAVLMSLMALKDDSEIATWASRWNLNAPWILESAVATRRFYVEFPTVQHYSWQDATPAWWGAEEVAGPKGTAQYKDRSHFDLLAAAVVHKTPWRQLGGSDKAKAGDPAAARAFNACKRLAKLLAIPLPVRLRTDSVRRTTPRSKG